MAALKLFFDGGCRPNPGAMEAAVVTRGISYIRRGIGHGTNNDAEWLALIHALEIARSLGAKDIIVVGDSALIVGQATHTAKCRGTELQRHLATFDLLAAGFDRVRVRRIGRHQNLAGIALEQARS